MLKEHHIKICANVIAERAGLDTPSLDKVEEIVKSSEWLVELLIKGYPEMEDGLDTLERGLLLDAVACHFDGTHWPCNEDNHKMDVNKWFKNLHVKAMEQGWKSRHVDF